MNDSEVPVAAVDYYKAIDSSRPEAVIHGEWLKQLEGAAW